MDAPKYTYHVTLISPQGTLRRYGTIYKISAIGLARAITGFGLKESEDLIEYGLQDQLGYRTQDWSCSVTVTEWCKLCSAPAEYVLHVTGFHYHYCGLCLPHPQYIG